MDIRQSIARVSGASDSDVFAGTAFLFSDGEDSQLWMTCHHVIRDLPSLRLSCHTGNAAYPFECTYRGDLSSPQVDIAVLESRLSLRDLSSLQLHPIPVGALPSSSADAQVTGCGFSRDAKTYPRGINFVGRFSAPQCLRIPDDDDSTRSLIASLGQPWNISFTEHRHVELYEFRDEGGRLEPGFSGAPVCIETDPVSGHRMCIGMLSTRRVVPTSLSTHGFVIPYEQIKEVCPRALPFHAYADYVVVVLAATRPEFEQLRAQLDLDALRERSEHYDETSRDGWRPFALQEPTIKAMIESAARSSRSCQLSSEFLDRTDRGFNDYLANRGAGALVFVVDPNSFAVPALRDFVMLARDHNRDACYIFPLCEVMHASPSSAIERKLQDQFGAQLWSRWHRERVKLSWDQDDFSDRFRSLLDRAWELYIHENRRYPRRRIGEAARTATTPFMDWAGS